MKGYCHNPRCNSFNILTSGKTKQFEDNLDTLIYCVNCDCVLRIEKYIDKKKLNIQVYKVNEEDYINNHTLSPKLRGICTDSLFEINNVDMVNINNLFLKSEKEFPLDGLDSKELWNIIMETGVNLKNLYRENLVDETFKNHISEILNGFILFCMLPENIKLKKVDSPNEKVI